MQLEKTQDQDAPQDNVLTANESNKNNRLAIGKLLNENVEFSNNDNSMQFMSFEMSRIIKSPADQIDKSYLYSNLIEFTNQK